jgi:hypothetical protein
LGLPEGVAPRVRRRIDEEDRETHAQRSSGTNQDAEHRCALSKQEQAYLLGR